MLIELSKPITLVLTKADKMKPKYVMAQSEKVIADVQKRGLIGTSSPLVHIVSTYTGYGMQEITCGVL
jgi:GTP-binding protein EngB required for normal cell division